MRFAAALFLSLILLPLSAAAQEDLISETPAAIALPSLPECSDSKLQNTIIDKISSYYRNNKLESIIDKRRQKLILKNLHDFTEIPVRDFSRKDNYPVAEKILMAKINNGLQDEEIRLCRSRGEGRVPVLYFLIYPENYYYMVDIINFRASGSSGKDFFVIYD